MIKYNNNTIYDWNFDTSNLIKVYRNNVIVFYKVSGESPTPEWKVCFAVVDDISQYQETEFDDVYDKATEKWYKLNNLNEYEQYGVYGSGRTSCEGSTSRLPQGYTEVEYIENTGTSYINTGVYLYDTTTTSYKIEAKISSSWYNSEFEYLIATEGTSSPYNGVELRWNTHYQSGNELQCESVPNNVVYSNIDNGDGTSAVTITCSATQATNNVPLSLFCGIWTSGPWRNGKGKFYTFKVTKNDTLVRDLVPAKRDSDDKYGMYDLITDTFYVSPNNVDFSGGEPIAPTDCVTTYDGKLTIDDGYEYEWNGSSWVNLGEVTGSTATLPDVPFTVNYNAKNYDASTHTFAKTNGQLANTDVTISGGTLTAHDGYVTVASGSRGVISGYGSYFNRTSSTPNLTIISKQRTDGNYCHMFANRDTNYNWMYRPYSNKLTLHGSSEQGQLAVTTQPVIESVRIDSNRLATYNNYTNNTTSTQSNFSYGSTNGSVALFAGYTSTDKEWFVGDFYWIYMSQTTLTDEQVQQVIDYNEGASSSEYPKYYSEKSDPLDNLTFNTMAEAQSYAEANCVYDGMHATIGADRYYFDSEDENGWVKILEYYKVEDVTPGGASGWTISGSSTYNPDSSYYDDFDLQTTSSSYSYKIAKVTIYGYDHFTYYLRSSGYSSYNYVVATNVDEIQTPPVSMSYNSASAITNTYNWNKSPKSAVNLSNYRRVTYNNLDKTVEHTFYVYFYGRTYSSYVGNATILIPKEQTNENWEQVTFSASSNVASNHKNLYIDNSNYSSGGTQYWYNRWIVGLPSGSHSSYTNYINYDYCPNVTSSTFTSVAGEQRQVNFTYDYVSNKTLSFRLTDGSNVLTPSDTVYYDMRLYNSCNVQSNSSNLTFPRNQYVKVGGGFAFFNSSNRHYIYGYQAPALATRYNTDDYQGTFDIVYTKLNDEAVTITYTKYDPSDVEVPAFKTDITYPYNGVSTSSTTLTSYDVPYTYPYTVKQTNDKFSADSQSFTAGQAARTINFTLYPNNREFASVADMEAYTYAWEGMTATVNGTKYQYNNGEWAEYTFTQYEYIQTQSGNYRYDFNTNFYPTTANTIEVKFTFTGNSIDWGHFICWSSCNGDGCDSTQFRFTTVTRNYAIIARKGNASGTQFYTIGNGKTVTVVMPLSSTTYTYNTGSTDTTCKYNSGTFSLPSTTPMHIFNLGYANVSTYAANVRLHYVKVYDGNGNLVKHYVPSDNNGTPCLYEIVNGGYIMDTYTGSNHGTLTLGPEV